MIIIPAHRPRLFHFNASKIYLIARATTCGPRAERAKNIDAYYPMNNKQVVGEER